MIRGKKVDITIKDHKTGKYLRIPVVPEVVDFESGDAIVTTVNVLKLGAVDFPNGVGLCAVSWSSFFPARYDASYCAYSNLKKPASYRDQLIKWKANGTSLQLIIPAANINKHVYLASCKSTLKGFEGDIYYDISFKELKKIRPIQLPITVVPKPVPPTPVPTPETRTPVPTPPQPKTYTVQAGDCLSRIAKQLGISSWESIYDLNRDQISNPNLIYPGQVFNLP